MIRYFVVISLLFKKPTLFYAYNTYTVYLLYIYIYVINRRSILAIIDLSHSEHPQSKLVIVSSSLTLHFWREISDGMKFNVL